MAKFSNLGVQNYKRMETEVRNAMAEYQTLVESLSSAIEDQRSKIMAEIARTEEWVESINTHRGELERSALY